MHLLILAAGTEVPAVAAPLPPELVSSLVTVLVSALLSGIAAGFNTFLRRSKKRGIRRGGAVMALGAGLNAVAFNFDQTARQGKAAIAAKKDEVAP